MSHWCRWEYRSLAFYHANGSHNPSPPAEQFSAELNKLGAEGWEVYFVGAGMVQLKRQHPVMPAAQNSPQRPRPESKPMSDLVHGKSEPETK